MKTIIFSDVHLTRRFDKRKFNFLSKIIRNADRVVINGDFWDGLEVSFEDFITSQWKTLFPLLRKKKAVYVYGNHDSDEFADKRVRLFSVAQTQKYVINLRNKTFVVEHGQRLLPLVDAYFQRWFGINPPVWLNILHDRFEGMGVRLFGKRFLNLLYSKFNHSLKSELSKVRDSKKFYIFGHTHLAEIDEENGFINDGLIRHGIGQYILIDREGDIRLMEEKY